VAAKDSNTSNLYSHLKTKHPEEFIIPQHASNIGSQQGKGQKSSHGDWQALILDLWNKPQTHSSPSKEHKALTNSVTYCLARDMVPLSTVDKPGFRAMLYQFNGSLLASILQKLQYLHFSLR